MPLTAALPEPDKYPALAALIAAILREWPEHEKFLQASFCDMNPDMLDRREEVASLVNKLCGDQTDRYVTDYHWMCDNFREEQLYFARHKHYRLSSVEEAVREVYGNEPYMSRYVRGILLSQMFWRNHAQAMDIFRTVFLPGNRDGYAHLDVGPGHGLFMVFAAQDPVCSSLTGWDLSPSSLASTGAALRRMNITRPVALEEADIVTVVPEADRFDSIICSEVLEHTEQPQRALDNMFIALRSGGRLFLNIPVNSPAPDHIYLWRDPVEVKTMIIECGYSIEYFAALPPTGKTLEQAKKYSFDISCVAIARKPG
jgi:2-polyprenyl-3-methyl-5-hydroxy-6-metoxy-1,4-benzoquinol methylase